MAVSALSGLRSGRSDLADLRVAAVHPIVIGVAGLGLAYDLLVAVYSVDMPQEAWAPALGLFTLAGVAYWTAPRGAGPVGLVLTVGLTLVLTSAVALFGAYPLVCAFAAIPIVAGILLGWRHGFAAAALATAAAWALARGGLVPPEWAVVAGGLTWVHALLGWVNTRPLQQTLEWSWHSYLQAQKKTEEARDRQGELGRLSRSLEEACQRLERANQELERARKAAEEARRLKTQFATTVSHEMRTPLNLIIGFSELMATAPQAYYGDALPPSYRDDVETIYTSACHLAQLVDDVLDLAQIDAERLGLDKEPVDLLQVVGEAAMVVESLFEKKGLALALRLPATLPAVQADRVRIRQIVVNLLSNAARFTSRGGVTVRAEAADGEVVLAIQDTGVGIPAESLRRAFEEFRQADGSVRHNYGGTGLGLAISKRLVELHGGSMSVESRLGEGSTFYFSLPLSGNVIATAPRLDLEGLVVRLPEDAPPIVALDPDGDLTRVLRRYLDGYRVARAASPDEAAAIAGQLHPRAIVVASGPADRNSDRLLDLAPRLPDLPLIACSIRGRADLARELEVDEYLLKPVTRDRLEATLERQGAGCGTILIVDDEPRVLRMLSRTIRAISPRYEVLTASGGREALEAMRVRVPDLVLLDLLMPEVDGYEVLRGMRADPQLRAVSVVVVTAKGYGEETVVGSVGGVTRAGGLSSAELIRCLRGCLDALRPRSEGGGTTPSTAPAPLEAFAE